MKTIRKACVQAISTNSRHGANWSTRSRMGMLRP